MGKADARWDNDIRGAGVGDAVDFLPPLQQLGEAMRRSDWVAEDPEAHLLPHLQRWCEREECALSIEQASSVDGTFEITLLPRTSLSPADTRREVFALLGTIAEGASFIHEQEHASGTSFEVTSGMLDDQTPFRSHGHTIRVWVAHEAVP